MRRHGSSGARIGRWALNYWQTVRSAFFNRKTVGLFNNLSVQILDQPKTNLVFY